MGRKKEKFKEKTPAEKLALALAVLTGIMLIAAFVVFILPSIRDSNKPATNFEECAAAGNQILESNPRVCITASGMSFTEESRAARCADDSACNASSFCAGGTCAPFAPETACSADADCTLASKTFKLSCCYEGRCALVDYASADYIPANARWLASMRARYCPAENECGPRPICETISIEQRFRAA